MVSTPAIFDLQRAGSTVKVWGMDRVRAIPKSVIILTIFGILIPETAI